jgi:hypothetical protein
MRRLEVDTPCERTESGGLILREEVDSAVRRGAGYRIRGVSMIRMRWAEHAVRMGGSLTVSVGCCWN